MSNKGWTAIHHWIWPITPPFTVVLTEGAVCAPQLARGGGGGCGRAPVFPPDRLLLFLAKAGTAPGWWAFVRQTGFGTSRWSSLLQNAPQLMEWDTTVTTWPQRKAALNRPAVFPCVTYGSKSVHVPSNPKALNMLRLCRFLFIYLFFFPFPGFVMLLRYCTSALITDSQSRARPPRVAVQDKPIPL